MNLLVFIKKDKMKDKSMIVVLQNLDKILHDMQMDEHQNEDLLPKINQCRGLIHEAAIIKESSLHVVDRNKSASSQYEQLKRFFLIETERIDNETVWLSTEPNWWIEMMDFQDKVRNYIIANKNKP